MLKAASCTDNQPYFFTCLCWRAMTNTWADVIAKSVHHHGIYLRVTIDKNFNKERYKAHRLEANIITSTETAES